ncbi:CHRD domain-containing protein [Elongatibacter sediminis]|uniref:CHRD domain-containing protein n=1 Tax=Elongatibacter sediminis TaxID=3119006 RepID=A0AAW9REF6_9GAMM
MKHWIIAVGLAILAAPAWSANAVNFRVELSGDSEVPPVVTDTTGTAILHVNRLLTEISIKLDIRNGSDVLGVAGAHLHCAPAGSNGGVVAFLAGPFTPGYDGDFQIRATLNDDSIIDDACGADIAGLVGSMLDGNVYINVHSSGVPSGVVRGQVE